MKKIFILILGIAGLMLLSACGNGKTTELAVQLEALEERSDAESTTENGGEMIMAPDIEPDTPSTISISPDFTAEQSRNMSNFSNGGLYYVSGEMLYGRLCPVSGGLMRMSVLEVSDDGEYIHSGTPRFIDDDVSPSYMVCSEGAIYYVREHNSDGAVSIARISADGGDAEILYENEDCNYLQLHSGRLFFTNGEHNFVSTDLNGSDLKIILEKEVFFPYFIDEEWVLYQDDADRESLHLFNVNSSFDIKLNDMRSYSPVIAGSALYYLGVPYGETNLHLCRIDLHNIELKTAAGVTEYTLDREIEIGNPEVYTLLMDGEHIYGANNAVASIEDWRDFTDEGYSYLSENCRYLHDGWALGFQLNSSGAVKNIFLRKLTTAAVSVLPRVYG